MGFQQILTKQQPECYKHDYIRIQIQHLSKRLYHLLAKITIQKILTKEDKIENHPTTFSNF